MLSGNRPSTLAVRPDLASDPARLSSARLDVQTGPLLATLGGRGDNRAAQALADALAAQHDFLARGGLPARPVTLAAYAGDLVAQAAMRAQHAAERRASATARWRMRSSSAPPRYRGSTSMRSWPAWFSCSRRTRSRPGSSR